MSERGQPDFDVLVVGGGPVGAATAAALADGKLRVGVIEASTDDPDLRRVVAITPASRRLLTRLGAWNHIPAEAVCPFHGMAVWDGGGFGEVRFDGADAGLPELGRIAYVRALQRSLYAVLAQREVPLIRPASVSALDVTEDHARVTLDDGQVLSTRLLVGADGARSKLRDWAGFRSRGWSYGQSGVVASVQPEHDHQHIAWQRFLPDGVLAFLPLADGRCSIVWSVSDERARELLALDDTAFCRGLGDAFEWRLGRIESVGPRAAFPLQLRLSDRWVRPRLALVGDAAHGVHPLAGQGVNLGLLDAATLAEQVRHAAERGRDPGDWHALRRYERARRADTLAMLGATDGLQRLFSLPFAPVRWVRGLGLSATDRMPFLKNWFMRYAAGERGDLPELARP